MKKIIFLIFLISHSLFSADIKDAQTDGVGKNVTFSPAKTIIEYDDQDDDECDCECLTDKFNYCASCCLLFIAYCCGFTYEFFTKKICCRKK